MAIGIVSEIKFNVTKTSKKGAEYTVTQLSFFTEAGGKKTESCFSDCAYAEVLKGLAPGDKIEATYVKNGEYFNLTDVKLLEKGDGVAPSFGGAGKASSTAGAKAAYGGKDPEVQAAIIRQNALTNAVHFVTSAPVSASLVVKGSASPSTDFLADLVINIAHKFEGYTSGRVAEEKLTGTVDVVTTTQPTSIPE
jgi:hypothetical protein